MYKNFLFCYLLIVSCSANAQFGGLLKDLKGVSEKIQNISGQSQSQTDVVQPGLGQPQSETRAQQLQEQQKIYDENQKSQRALAEQRAQQAKQKAQNVPQKTRDERLQEQKEQEALKTQQQIANNPIFVKNFRGAWCRSVDNINAGKHDYKGIKTGDICLAPDKLIIAIKDLFVDQEIPYDWMTDSSLLKELDFIKPMYIEYDDVKIIAMTLYRDAKTSKIYMGNFSGLICAASRDNNLNQGNNFRVALEAKYGKPKMVHTEYESLSAQLDTLEGQIKESKRRQITVAEAKSNRQAEDSIANIKQMLKNADKNEVKSIQWQFDKSDGLIGLVKVQEAEKRTMREFRVPTGVKGVTTSGGCMETNTKDFEGLGFSIDFTAPAGVAKILDNMIAASKKEEEKQNKLTPTPKL